MKLDDFKAQVNKSNGFARNNLFELDINMNNNSSMSNFSKNKVNDNLNMFAKAASLPAATTSTIEFYHNGKAYKIPGDRQYEPWTCTFFVDAYFETKNAIIDWIESCRSFEPRVHLEPFDSSSINPAKDLTIKVLNRQGKGIHKIKMYQAYPTSIQGGDLDYGNNDSIMEITCQFDYQYWIVDGRPSK